MDIRNTDIEFRWRAAPLTKALATCAALALVVAVIGSRWQLIVFAAPLLGVLCSISWQRPASRFQVHAQPASQRCFEGEAARLTLWLTAEPGGADAKLTASSVVGVRLDIDGGSGDLSQAVAVTAGRWGRYPVRATVAVSACGGLLAGEGTVDAADVIVFPLAPPQPTPIPRTDLPDRLGIHLTRHIGRGVEYADIRSYVPGDPLRMVNWPVSARRGRLHVTQRLTDRAADVVVLIDGYPQVPGPATDATERTARGAAQVLQTALRNGDRAGVVTLGGRSPRWFGADIGQRQYYRVIDTILGVGEEFESTNGTLAPRAAVPAGAVVVAFSTLLDSEFALALFDLRQRGHVVIAVDVLDGAPFGDEEDRLVNRIWSSQRSAMYRDMASMGVEVVAWQAEHLLPESMRLATDRRRR